MAPTKRTISPLIAEVLALQDKHKETIYAEIAASVAAEGFVVQLTETGCVPCPDATVLITFDMLVGKDDGPLESFTPVTMRMPPGPGPLSIAARVAARESVLFLLTGRLPPAQAPMQPPASPPPAPAPQMNGGEQHVDMRDADTDLGGDEQPAGELNLVDRYEPDGVPILVDVFDITPDGGTRAIVDGIIEVIEKFASTAMSEEQLMALGSKNPDMMAFLADYGTADDKKAAQDAIRNRRVELAKPATTPRRRAAAAAN